MDKLTEKTLDTEIIFNGRIVKLQVDTVLLPNGQTSKREIIKHSGAVGIIAVTSENKLVLVKQFRKPLEKTLIEIPAGKLEPGEEPAKTAIRELEEETAYTAGKLTLITTFYTSPGFADELMYLYVAEDLKKLENPPALDEDEFVEIMEMSLEEAKELVLKQEIQDAKTNYAVLYLEAMEAKSSC